MRAAGPEQILLLRKVSKINLSGLSGIFSLVGSVSVLVCCPVQSQLYQKKQVRYDAFKNVIDDNLAQAMLGSALARLKLH